MNLLKKKIQPTKSTPEITLNPNGMIRIKGRSMIGNIIEFSRQIDDWIDKYLIDPADLTCVDFYLEYLNTNNLKFYISLLKKIETVKLKNKKLMINWYYEEGDEDIIEKGEYISSVLDIPYNFIMLSDLDNG
jgi:hypothetical protein